MLLEVFFPGYLLKPPPPVLEMRLYLRFSTTCTINRVSIYKYIYVYVMNSELILEHVCVGFL